MNQAINCGERCAGKFNKEIGFSAAELPPPAEPDMAEADPAPVVDLEAGAAPPAQPPKEAEKVEKGKEAEKVEKEEDDESDIEMVDLADSDGEDGVIEV